jgi:hypothetical protein
MPTHRRPAELRPVLAKYSKINVTLPIVLISLMPLNYAVVRIMDV